MLLSRAFEERAAEEYAKGNIVGFLQVVDPNEGHRRTRLAQSHADSPTRYGGPLADCARA
jgi:TPP-dependent pyruvate/acetoin dehydrogenase alpha subunit